MKRGFLNSSKPKAKEAPEVPSEVCRELVSDIVELSTHNRDMNNVNDGREQEEQAPSLENGGVHEEGDEEHLRSNGSSMVQSDEALGSRVETLTPDDKDDGAWQEPKSVRDASPDTEPSRQEQAPSQRSPSPKPSTPPPAPPPPPSPPSLEIVSTSQTNVCVRCTGDAPASTFSIRFAVAADGEEQQKFVEGFWDSPYYKAMVSGLRPGKKHAVWVILATELHGDIVGVKQAFSTRADKPDRPQPPTVSGKQKNSIKLRWTPPQCNGEPITSYQLELGEGSNPQHFFLSYEGTEPKCEVKNLRPGTVYTMMVRAVNSVGRGQLSDALKVETHATTPSAPEQPYLLHMALGSLSIGWYPPFETGGSEITGYTLECDDGTDNGHFMIKYNGPDFSYTLQPTNPNQQYRFRVRAQNNVGISQYSAVLDIVGACGPPGPPGAVQMSRQGAYALCVCWEPPSITYGSPVTLYQVGMRAIVDGVPLSQFSIVYVGEACCCDVSGLQPACAYEFVAVAVSPLGPSPPSPPSIFPTGSTAPSSTDPPYLIQSGRNSLHVGWHSPVITNGAPITAYRLEQLTHDQADSIPLFEGLAGDFVMNGLEPGCPVWLRVAAANMHGYGPSSAVVCFNTTCAVPSTPVGVEAVAKGRSAVHVTWSVPHKNGGAAVTGYRVHVQRVGDGDQRTESRVVDVQEQCATLEGLNAGCMYAVCVQACNSEGFGTVSAHVTFVTDAAPPGATDVPELVEMARGLRITWTPPSKDNGAPVVEYLLQMNDGSHFTDLYKGSLCSFEVASLQPGATYKFRVSAVNRVGQGPFSPAAQHITSCVEPGPPVGVTLLGVTYNSVKLKWAPPAFTGGSAPHTYSVLIRHEDGELREAWSGGTTSAKAKAPCDATFDVCVVAYNSVGRGTVSAGLRVSTPPAPSKGSPVARAPAVLASPSVSVKGPNNAVVTWAGAGGKDKRFVLLLCAEDGKERVAYEGGSTSHELKNLKPGGQYSVQVAAENDIGRGDWSQATSFTTKLGLAERNANKRPSPPKGLTLDKAGKNFLKFSWSHEGDHSEGVSYNVEMAAEDAEFVCVYTGESTECKAMKLSSSSRYRVRVQAVNKHGSGAYCSEKTFKTSSESSIQTAKMLQILFVLIGVVCTILYLYLSNFTSSGSGRLAPYGYSDGDMYYSQQAYQDAADSGAQRNPGRGGRKRKKGKEKKQPI